MNRKRRMPHNTQPRPRAALIDALADQAHTFASAIAMLMFLGGVIALLAMVK